MDSGSYEWKIEGEKLLAMKKSKRKQEFVSVFKMCELNWRISACPNGSGNNDEGSFDVYLKLISLHKAWNHILICRRTHCPQLQISRTATYEYDHKHKNWGWSTNTMHQSQIQDLDELTIITTITILKIVLNDNNKILYQKDIIAPLNKKIEWNINKEIFNKMIMTKNGNLYETHIFDDIWCLGLYPNGYKSASKGFCCVRLALCGLSANISKVTVNYKYQLLFQAKDDQKIYHQNNTDHFDLDKDYYWNTELKQLTFDEFKQYESLTITCDIIIIDKYDMNGNSASLLKWSQFAKDQDSKQEKAHHTIEGNHGDHEETKEQDWNCDICTYLNVCQDGKCAMCQIGTRPAVPHVCN